MEINYFDVTVIVILALFALRGCFRGFVDEISGLIGLIGGLWMARHFYQDVSPLLTFVGNEQLRGIMAYVLVFLAFLVVVAIVGHIVKRLVSLAFIGWVDKLAGLALGLVKGFIICSVLLLLVKNFLPEAGFVKTSFMYGHLSAIMAQVQAHLPENFFDFFKF